VVKKDIYILNQVAGEYPEGEFEFSFGTQVQSITGIQKLINTFLLYFLTSQGSELTNSLFGTFLGQSIGGNLIPVLKSKIRVDLAKTAVNIKTDQTDVPDDEALDSVKALDITFLKDTIDLTLEFKSRAGETLTIKFPTIVG
jgi:hypothetical protein